MAIIVNPLILQGIDNIGITSANALVVVDGGTTWDLQIGGSTVLKIRKSDNQLLLDAGSTDDAF